MIWCNNQRSNTDLLTWQNPIKMSSKLDGLKLYVSACSSMPATYISFHNITSTIIAGLPSSPMAHSGKEWQPAEREDAGSTIGNFSIIIVLFFFGGGWGEKGVRGWGLTPCTLSQWSNLTKKLTKVLGHAWKLSVQICICTSLFLTLLRKCFLAPGLQRLSNYNIRNAHPKVSPERGTDLFHSCTFGDSYS